MVAEAEKDRVRALVADTITLLCKNGLSYKSEFSIEALIGITLDKSEIMLININETVKTAEALEAEAAPPSPKSPISPHRRKRKKRRSSTQLEDVVDSKKGLIDVVAQQEHSASSHMSHSNNSPQVTGASRNPPPSTIPRSQNNVPSLSLSDMQEDSANLWTMDMGDGDRGDGGGGGGDNGLKPEDTSQRQEPGQDSDFSDSECVVIKSEEGSGEDSNISGVFPSQFFQGDQFGGQQQMGQGEGAMWDMAAAGTSAGGGDERFQEKGAVFYCEDCNKVFTNRRNLGRHKANVHSASRSPCPLCDLQYSRQDAVYNHIRFSHHINLTSGTNKCAFCECTFFGQKLYYEHLKLHSDTVEGLVE